MLRKNPKASDFIVSGFVLFVMAMVILWGLYFYMNKIDPTKRLYFYPDIEVNKEDNYTLLFPAFDNSNFTYEKKALNYKTIKVLLGRKIDISNIRERYEFGFIKVKDDKYIIYDNKNIPYLILYTENNILIGITDIYIYKADFKNEEVRGFYFEEIKRLDNFLKNIGISEFVAVKSDLYFVRAYRKEKDYNLVYNAAINTKKEISSLTDLISSYKEEDKYVSIYISIFINKDLYTPYSYINYKYLDLDILL